MTASESIPRYDRRVFAAVPGASAPAPFHQDPPRRAARQRGPGPPRAARAPTKAPGVAGKSKRGPPRRRRTRSRGRRPVRTAMKTHRGSGPSLHGGDRSVLGRPGGALVRGDAARPCAVGPGAFPPDSAGRTRQNGSDTPTRPVVDSGRARDRCRGRTYFRFRSHTRPADGFVQP